MKKTGKNIQHATTEETKESLDGLDNPADKTRLGVAKNLGSTILETTIYRKISQLISYAIDKTYETGPFLENNIDSKRLIRIIEGVNDAVYMISPEGKIEYMSPVIEKISPGFLTKDIVNTNFLDYVYPDDIPKVQEAFSGMVTNKAESVSEFRTIDKKGELRWLRGSGNVILKDEAVVGIVGVLTDITDNKILEEKLKKSNELFEDVSEIAKIGGWELDTITNEIVWTKQMYKISGIEPDGHPPSLEDGLALLDEDSQNILNNAIDKAMSETLPFNLELPVNMPDGSKKWLNIVGKVNSSNGKVKKLAGTVQDITVHKKLEELHKEKNSKDELTGLFNRNYYEQKIQEYIKEAKPVSVVYIDVDGLHSINNNYGHLEGDNLLIDLSNILITNFRENDIVFRTGGDEFVTIIPSDEDEIILTIIKRIKNAVEVYNKIKNHPQLSISMGYESSSSSQNLLAIIAKADEAMLESKRSKMNGRDSDKFTI